MAVKQFRTRRSIGERKVFELLYERVIQDAASDEDAVETKEQIETFHAVPEVPGKWLLEIGASLAGDDGERSHAINNFLNRVIVNEEKVHWDAVLQDTENIVDIDLLGDIVNWLMEEYGENPTEQSKS